MPNLFFSLDFEKNLLFGISKNNTFSLKKINPEIYTYLFFINNLNLSVREKFFSNIFFNFEKKYSLKRNDFLKINSLFFSQKIFLKYYKNFFFKNPFLSSLKSNFFFLKSRTFFVNLIFNNFNFKSFFFSKFIFNEKRCS